MKTTTLCSLILLAISSMLSVPAFGGSTYSKKVPKAAATPSRTSTIALDAKNTAAGLAKGPGTPPNPLTTRETTNHMETIEINVRNFGHAVQNITIQWFWVGRYETSGNWFRSGDGEKALQLDPAKSETVLAENADIEAHNTKGNHEHYKSGGNRLGWVVVAYNSNHEIQAIKTSASEYNGFVGSPPPKKRRTSTPSS